MATAIRRSGNTRLFLTFAQASLLAAIAGCSPSGEPASRGESAAAAKQALVVAVGADESGLRLNRPRLGRYPLNAGICETLVKMTSDFQVAPSLATKWEYRGDNTYRFILRRGVKFHGGSTLGAKDVQYTLNRGVEEKTQYSFLSTESARVLDDSTIDIRPAIPNLRLLEQLAHPSYGIISDRSDSERHPDCTGAFRLESYAPQESLSVVRNENYYGTPAKLDRLTFRFMPDDNTRALALRAGEVDLIVDVNRSIVSGLKTVSGLKVVSAQPGAVLLMYIATNGTPPYRIMSDPDVRRAVAMAIDRSTLVSQVMEGYAAVVPTVNPPAVLGDHAAEVKGIPYDPEGAARILELRGWKRINGNRRMKDGKPLTLVMIMQPSSGDRGTAQYVQAQLARVGIDMRIEELDAAAYESRLNAGTFDLDIELPNQNDANPAFLLALRWYSKSNVHSALYMRAGPRFDSLVTKSLASSDNDVARENAAQAMHILVDEEVDAIPLAGLFRIYAMKSRVNGFDPHPSRLNQSWTTVWMTR
ncbi:MAG: ABC transporter substrate-binding protein [Gemmatimonadaceae bacterium]